MSTPLPLPRTLLDTDIFSEFLRGRHAQVAIRAAQYQQVYGHFTLSAMTLMEMSSGWQRRGQQARIAVVLQHIQGWDVLAMSAEIATLAGRMDGDLLRTGQPIGLADTVIAATAVQHSLVLATGNEAHYLRLVALGYPLQIDNWRL